MVVQNATMSSLSMLATVPTYTTGWIVTACVFLTVIVMIFLLSKNFRQFCYGSVVTGVLGVIYWVSRYIGKSSGTGNFGPLKVFAYIAGFIIISILIGKLLQQSSYIKELESEWNGPIDNNKRKKKTSTAK